MGLIDLTLAELLAGNFEQMEVFLISRLPRLLAILCTGIGMSVAGLIMQQLCSNKFVSPTTGATISSAQFGILLALLFMPASTLWSRAIFAFATAILGTWIFVWFIQRIQFKDVVMVPLVGIMFGNVIGGITNYLAYKYEMTQALSSWLVGHFSLVLKGRYEIVWLTVPLVVLAFLFANHFNIVGLGKDFSKNLGIPYNLVLFSGLTIAAMITASIVVVVGSISYIGLIVPNVVAMYKGDKIRGTLVDTALFGAIFVLVCDMIGRIVIAPYELPIELIIQYNRLYAYEKGEDGKPKIIQEQAEVVRSIYEQYLSGASLRMIKERLEMEQIPNVTGGSQWTITAIRSILTNEKYCGDVLLQKTYISDCISRKVIRNTGQLPMYLVQNHHEGIVERKTFDAVQAEMARRSAGKSPSKKNAPTGMTSYASKYALSERLVCGECGTLHRRCTWSKQGRKRIVWRCVSRLDYGTKYCHNSPTLDEEPLQKAILAAINSVMSEKSTLIRKITSAMEMELAPVPGESMSLADIERRLGELNDQTRELVAESARVEDATACTAQLRAIMNEAAILKEKRALIEEQRQSNAQAVRRIEDAAAAMAQASTHISEWDEALIRQLVDTVKVNSAEKITVFLRGGVQVEQGMITSAISPKSHSSAVQMLSSTSVIMFSPRSSFRRVA